MALPLAALKLINIENQFRRDSCIMALPLAALKLSCEILCDSISGVHDDQGSLNRSFSRYDFLHL